jgi:hypothetical protein
MAQAKQRGEYPTDWRAISTALKEEAQWCCVRCSQRNEGSAIGVHHFDGNRENNERWNLMVLCQRCHLSVQARVDPQVTLMFDPSPWAMPYIAGFYEANRGTPGPLYDLQRWIEEYEKNINDWPTWAPKRK